MSDTHDDELEEGEIDPRGLELIRPITNKEWWCDPNEPRKYQPTKTTSKLSADALKLLGWVRRKHFREHLPTVSYDRLCKLSIGDLRTAASVFKAFNGESMRSAPRGTLYLLES